jgi:hypothetical protein
MTHREEFKYQETIHKEPIKMDGRVCVHPNQDIIEGLEGFIGYLNILTQHFQL